MTGTILQTTRYVTPLREGSSLPAIVEADDGNMYVMKFAGAGQGPKALIAELIAGEIARLLGLRVPEIAILNLDATLGPSEPDPEIFDLLRASTGLNLGLRYLPGAFAFTPVLRPPPDAALASSIVWFDALVTNVDRTVKNVNLLLWEGGLWLIDHGSSLYVHHDWKNYEERSATPFPHVKDHVLLPFAGSLQEADASLRHVVSPDHIRHIVAMIPDQWLAAPSPFAGVREHRAAYETMMQRRLDAAPQFVQEAMNARARIV